MKRSRVQFFPTGCEFPKILGASYWDFWETDNRPIPYILKTKKDVKQRLYFFNSYLLSFGRQDGDPVHSTFE